jgi:SGNH hydrolase-like domain, acetyltransferase AlgX
MAVVLATALPVLMVQEMAVRLAMPAYDPAGQLKFQAGIGERPALGRPGPQHQINNAGDYDVAFSFNGYGFRDDKDLAASTEDDWFVVGDSFALGWGIANGQRFSDLFAALIGRRVFNIAIPANIDGYPLLVDYAQAKGARIGHLAIAVNMSDDLSLAGQPAPSTTEQAAPSSGNWLMPAKEFMLGHSALYFLVTSLIHHSALKPVLVSWGLIKPVAVAQASSFPPDVVQRGADILAGLARRFDSIVLLIPDPARWSAANRAQAIATQDALAAALRARGVKVVDLAPMMEAGGQPLAYHFRGDRHWTPAGHGLAAKALAQAVGR